MSAGVSRRQAELVGKKTGFLVRSVKKREAVKQTSCKKRGTEQEFLFGDEEKKKKKKQEKREEGRVRIGWTSSLFVGARHKQTS